MNINKERDALGMTCVMGHIVYNNEEACPVCNKKYYPKDGFDPRKRHIEPKKDKWLK